MRRRKWTDRQKEFRDIARRLEAAMPLFGHRAPITDEHRKAARKLARNMMDAPAVRLGQGEYERPWPRKEGAS